MELSTPITSAGQVKDWALDAQEFEAVVRENQRRIFRLLMVLLRDPDAAATLTQECFLKAYKGWANFRGDSSVATWLNRIAVNLAHDHRRNRRLTFWRKLFERHGEEDLAHSAEMQPAKEAGAERRLIGKETAAAVWAAVDRLPTQQRTIFTLRFAEEMSIEEIAEAMQLKPGTVKTHLFRALGTVRKQFAQVQ